MDSYTRISDHLIFLYGEETGKQTAAALWRLLDEHRPRIPCPLRTGINEKDAILITYADQLRHEGSTPLQTLARFASRRLKGLVSGIHLLPFFPYSSDDGFSVIDYTVVNPEFGTWNGISRLDSDFRLMFDAVINHISVKSEWFRGFLKDDPTYRDYFITVPENANLSRVIRPRTLPLLTPFTTPGGEKHVWTTFSADQVDLNYRNPAVLLNILDILLLYIEHGAEFIRLDAIAFLWKEYGTTCLHLPQTHHVIKLIRAALDEIAPHVALITETNVPHAENLSYFGNGADEAQLIYNFALPPLTLHAFQTGSAEKLSEWAGGLSLPSNRVTFFNFLASHDGVGLNPARGILSEAEIDGLVQKTLAQRGFVSNKNNPDGSASPYELNINYYDALNDPTADEPLGRQVERFLTSQAIMLALVGLPGIYFHSLFGSRGWRKGVEQNGSNRAINRQKLDEDDLERELNDPAGRRSRVFNGYAQLLRARASQSAFDPYGSMQVLDAGPSVFAVLRCAGCARPVLCLHNVSAQAQTLSSSLMKPLDQPIHNLLDRRMLNTEEGITLAPYQTLWLGSLNTD